MIIGLITADLSIPESQSLKDKRRVIRSLRDRARNRMNVSVAEVDSQDSRKFATMGFATVAAETQTVQKRLSAISSFLDSEPRCTVLKVETEIL
jgi:hypothetical protein